MDKLASSTTIILLNPQKLTNLTDIVCITQMLKYHLVVFSTHPAKQLRDHVAMICADAEKDCFEVHPLNSFKMWARGKDILAINEFLPSKPVTVDLLRKAEFILFGSETNITADYQVQFSSNYRTLQYGMMPLPAAIAYNLGRITHPLE